MILNPWSVDRTSWRAKAIFNPAFGNETYRARRVVSNRRILVDLGSASQTHSCYSDFCDVSSD